MSSDQEKINKKSQQGRLRLQTVGYNIAWPETELQHPFDVAVVMITVLRPTLRRAVQSVFNQNFAGRIHVLIGVDKAVSSRELLSDIFDSCPRNCLVTLLNPRYSTSVRHGGLYPARDGGALRTVLSYMANSRYVAYLDDDNWWHKDHLSSMLTVIRDVEWAFSLRWYVDPVNHAPLCIDRWELVGPDAGFFRERFGGFVDPSCLMIDKLLCEKALPWWTTPLPGDKKGMSADRHVFSVLRKNHVVAGTGKATCYYTLDPKDGMHPRRQRWIRETLRKQNSRSQGT